MLVYMLNELFTEKKLSTEKVLQYLNTYTGDPYSWYNGLDCVSVGWRRVFFGKYLPASYADALRVLYGRLGEQQILSRIAYVLKLDQQKFSNSPEAREKSLEILSSSLQTLDGYKGSTTLMAYINAQIQNVFRDHEDKIKTLLEQTFSAGEADQEIRIDQSVLDTVDPAEVYEIFESITAVDAVFGITKQTTDFRQYSFLSAYQLWCFGRKLEKINEYNKLIVLNHQDFNKQYSHREHSFATKLFRGVMPIAASIKGTADIRLMFNKISEYLQDYTNNSGVNVPITFTPISAEGSWFEDILNDTLVPQSKRGSFDKLLHAFLAIGRLHSLLDTAGVEFPYFYPDLAKNPHYLFKFKTLRDYLEHSNKVLEIITKNNLPISVDAFMRHSSFEKSAVPKPQQTPNFDIVFTSLIKYNAFLSQELVNSSRRRISLRLAYHGLTKGLDPLTYVLDDYPERASDFRVKQFERTANEEMDDTTLCDNILPFYKSTARNTHLVPFRALYESFVGVYEYFKTLVGVSENSVVLTGKPTGIRVTGTEFSVIVTEHPALERLRHLSLPIPIHSNASLSRIVGVLIDNDEAAVSLVDFLSSQPPTFSGHWLHIQQILTHLYKVSQDSKGILFSFGASCHTPPFLPDALAQRNKALVEITQKPQRILAIQEHIEEKGYSKDAQGFLMTRSQIYVTEFHNWEVYFKHADGYSVSSSLEIKL